jgi:spoIIIJ-associated protein
MSEYKEFTGKTVEEAIRNAREAFGVTGLDDLDFEILTPGSRGVLGMGAEPARIVAAPRSALGGSAPRREAAAATPLPPSPPREERAFDRDRGRGGDRDRDRGGDRDRGRGGFRDRGFGRERADTGGRPPRPDRGDERPAAPTDAAVASEDAAAEPLELAPRPEGAERPERPERSPRDRGRGDRGGRDRGRAAPGRERRPAEGLSEGEQEQVAAAARAPYAEREEIQAASATPEALAAGKDILEELMRHLGFDVTVSIGEGETSKLNVTGEGDEREALGALIGRKGERLSALQHLVNLMLSRRMGGWTRVLVDVEDYRGRRERQLAELAMRAADRVVETGKMLQLEPMPALERRWIHIALRDVEGVVTQSIGEEPNRRVVVLRRET